jgi:hypothetical protein
VEGGTIHKKDEILSKPRLYTTLTTQVIASATETTHIEAKDELPATSTPAHRTISKCVLTLRGLTDLQTMCTTTGGCRTRGLENFGSHRRSARGGGKKEKPNSARYSSDDDFISLVSSNILLSTPIPYADEITGDHQC